MNALIKKRNRISVFVTIWLMVIWILLFGNVTPLIVIGGLILVLAVQLMFPLPHTGFFRHMRPWHTVVLTTRFIWDLVLSAIHVATVVVTGRSYDCSIVRIDLKSRSDIIIAITAAMTNLVPGTIVVKMNRREGVIHLHVFDIEHQGGVEGVRRTTRGQEERVLRAFASKEELIKLGVTL
ncbi:MAG: Na+/H+ antiporter subunit E [Actinomycetaceae bacterium]|nr:Na+/H+ antiporter subunit E [Actinomycetaceae bacterium]